MIFTYSDVLHYNYHICYFFFRFQFPIQPIGVNKRDGDVGMCCNARKSKGFACLK